MFTIKDIIRNISWVAGMRYFTRGMGLLESIILARFFLDPYQFGLFAIASLILAFLEIVTETGINVFLIQQKESIIHYINAAWIVSIFRGLLIGLLLFSLSSPIAHFFNTKDAYGLLEFISLVPVIRGFINPAIITFQKELFFQKEFYLRSSLVVIETGIALATAFITQNAYCLVWGILASAVFEVIFSFLFIKPIPSLAWDTKAITHIFHKGKWVTIYGIFSYIAQQGDSFIVGKIAGVVSLGFYQMAYNFGTIPISEVTEVVHKVFFPSYTKLSTDTKHLFSVFIRNSAIVSLVILFAGSIIFLFTPQIVLYTIGTKWLQIVPLIRLLLIYGVLRAIFGLTDSLFLAVGKQAYLATITFLRFFVLAITIVPLTMKFGTIGAAYSVLASIIFELPLIVIYMLKMFK